MIDNTKIKFQQRRLLVPKWQKIHVNICQGPTFFLVCYWEITSLKILHSITRHSGGPVSWAETCPSRLVLAMVAFQCIRLGSNWSLNQGHVAWGRMLTATSQLHPPPPAGMPTIPPSSSLPPALPPIQTHSPRLNLPGSGAVQDGLWPASLGWHCCYCQANYTSVNERIPDSTLAPVLLLFSQR